MKKLIKMIIKKIYNILNLISYLYIKKNCAIFHNFYSKLSLYLPRIINFNIIPHILHVFIIRVCSNFFLTLQIILCMRLFYFYFNFCILQFYRFLYQIKCYLILFYWINHSNSYWGVISRLIWFHHLLIQVLKNFQIELLIKKKYLNWSEKSYPNN